MKIRILLSLVIFMILFNCTSDSTDAVTSPAPFTTASLNGFLDSQIISDLLLEIDNGTYGEVNSLLIMKNDTLVLEKYFRGFEANQLHRCYSVTKSFTSALIGIAIDKGFINSVDKKIHDFFPQYTSFTNSSEQKQNITLDHVLKMAAGYEWDEWTFSYNDSRNIVSQLVNSSDWIKFMLDLPMANSPGSSFNYNSGCTVLLAGVIYETTGLRASAFAEEHLFGPLSITNYQWEEGPSGITNTGWGLRLSTRDILKLGKLFYQKGIWEGERIISEGWVNNSTQTKIAINSRNTYAYQWWTFSGNHSYVQQLETNDVFYADGWGNQYVFVIPHLNLIVATHAENYDGGIDSAPMLRDYIIPAAMAVTD